VSRAPSAAMGARKALKGLPPAATSRLSPFLCSIDVSCDFSTVTLCLMASGPAGVQRLLKLTVMSLIIGCIKETQIQSHGMIVCRLVKTASTISSLLWPDSTFRTIRDVSVRM